MAALGSGLQITVNTTTQETQDKPSIHLVLSGPHVQNWLTMSFLKKILGQWNIQDVQDLCFSINGMTMCTEDWIDLFGLAKGVTSVHATHAAGNTLCRALSMSTTSQVHAESSSDIAYPQALLFPALSQLKLGNVEFSLKDNGIPLYQVFSHALSLRVAHRCHPVILEIESSRLKPDYINLWLFCVPKDQRRWDETTMRVDSWY